MFEKNILINRRSRICDEVQSGLIFLYGNNPVPMNYPSNTLRFRQDSNFLYYCGLDFPGLNVIIDTESKRSILFGDDLTSDDIVWEGSRISIMDMAIRVGIEESMPTSKLEQYLSSYIGKIHYLPAYRADHINLLKSLFKNNIHTSKELISSVIAQRSIKAPEEILEIESALEITAEMHKLAMQNSSDGVTEQSVVGKMEGYALSNGSRLAYPSIFTINGEILHNNNYHNFMKNGQLLLNDSGAESSNYYASDITRTFPVSGKFSSQQKEIYSIVFKMQEAALKLCKAGNSFKSAHLEASRIAVEGLKNLGLMRGDPDNAVQNGAHALFFPHGLGHMLGLDVHDMEGLGEDLVGYEFGSDRSDQFGLAYLRLSKELKSGFVITVEPGIYFIPHLIEDWASTNKLVDFIIYDEVKKYKGFGGIRIEDNVHITENGHEILGPNIPKTISEIETCMAGNA